MASSLFLAIPATLQQAAKELGDRFPEAAEDILCDFYVDDLLTWADTGEKIAWLKEGITKISSEAQFNLGKWKSNVTEMIKLEEPKNTV